MNQFRSIHPQKREREMGGYALGSAFDSKSGQMIMLALLLMVGSFYLGTLFGNNAPIYVSQSFASNSSSAVSSPGTLFSFFLLFCFFFSTYICVCWIYCMIFIFKKKNVFPIFEMGFEWKFRLLSIEFEVPFLVIFYFKKPH